MAETPEQRRERLLHQVDMDGEDYASATDHTRSWLEGRIEGMLTAAWLLDALSHEDAQHLADMHLNRRLTVDDIPFGDGEDPSTT